MRTMGSVGGVGAVGTMGSVGSVGGVGGVGAMRAVGSVGNMTAPVTTAIRGIVGKIIGVLSQCRQRLGQHSGQHRQTDSHF